MIMVAHLPKEEPEVRIFEIHISPFFSIPIRTLLEIMPHKKIWAKLTRSLQIRQVCSSLRDNQPWQNLV